MRGFHTLFGGCVLLAVLVAPGVAHFRLLEPASWLQESELGDPQWAPPCGGTSTDPGKPTGAITNIRGGDKLHIRIREMAFHPGFYRVALAVNSRDNSHRIPKPEPKQAPTVHGPFREPFITRLRRRFWRTAYSSTSHRSIRNRRPRSRFRTSTAQNVLCRLSSSWRPMAGTERVTTLTIIALSFRFERIRTSR